VFDLYPPVLRIRRVPSRLTAVFLSAMPLGMASLTMILCVQEWTGSLRAAGWISGLFGAGNAIGLAVQGPLMDRFGNRLVVLATGGTCTASLVTFVVTGNLRSSLMIPAAVAAIAGLCVPAITTAVRAWLPAAVEDASYRRASYALLSALFQSATAIGPVLVSLAVILSGPTLGIWFAAVMILTATAVYALPGDRRDLKTTERRGTPVDEGGPGPHTRRPTPAPRLPRMVRQLSPGLLTVLAAAGFEGLGVGIVAVAIPGVMTAANVAALAGIAFGAQAAGEVLGALAFGARRRSRDQGTRLPLVQTAVTMTALLVFAVSSFPWLIVAGMFLTGLMGAPRSIIESTVLDDVAPQAALARSYSSLVAVGLASGALGNALAGQLVEATGTRGLLAVPIVVLATAAIWTGARRRTLTPEPESI
jgi:MFS family permease